MKAVRIISCLLVLASLIASCSEPETEPIDKLNYQELNIRAELSGESVHMNNGSIVNLTGTTNCNLADNTCVSLYGIIKNLQFGAFEIENGFLRVYAENTGCYLSGTFQGRGQNYINDISMHATVKVFCGTGAFQADGGELDLRITGMDPNGNFMVEIDGNLIR